MFTIVFLDSLKPRSKPYRKFEKSGYSGFGVQVSSGGSKTFFYYYKIKGKQRFMKLGVYGSITLKEAREYHHQWHKVKQDGYDPQIVKAMEIRELEYQYQEAKKEKIKQNMQGSYQQLLDAYVDDMRKNDKKSWANVQQVLNANAYKSIARSKKARLVTSDDVNRTLEIIENRGAYVVVNRVRGYLSAAFSFGIRSDKGRGRAVDRLWY